MNSPLARNTDPITSDIAAEKLVASGKHNFQKTQTYNALKRYKQRKDENPTSAELAYFSGLDRYMVARRLPDLQKNGLVRKVDRRVCSVTTNPAVTWDHF